jgi:hypothetical protein
MRLRSAIGTIVLGATLVAAGGTAATASTAAAKSWWRSEYLYVNNNQGASSCEWRGAVIMTTAPTHVDDWECSTWIVPSYLVLWLHGDQWARDRWGEG